MIITLTTMIISITFCQETAGLHGEALGQQTFAVAESCQQRLGGQEDSCSRHLSWATLCYLQPVSQSIDQQTDCSIKQTISLAVDSVWLVV